MTLRELVQKVGEENMDAEVFVGLGGKKGVCFGGSLDAGQPVVRNENGKHEILILGWNMNVRILDVKK